jgi:hypothetical protein
MFGFLPNGNLFKVIQEIVRQGGASPKNKKLIGLVVDFLKEKNMTPEEFEKELKEGKGVNVFRMLFKKKKNNNDFIEILMREVKNAYSN